jgi:predicted chitinase
MGQNIKDFKNWKRVNEETFLGYLAGLTTSAFTGSEAPSAPSMSSSPIATALGAADKAASNLGVKDAAKSEKPKRKDIDKSEEPLVNTKFKKFNKKIPAENVASLEAAMDRHGITNEFARKAILGVISKESATLVPEIGYNSTSNDRIRMIFGDRVKGLSDSELTALKNNQSKFWDRVYGPDDPTGRGAKYGNTESGDGEKYRGRGFNGITFKSNYKKLQQAFDKIGKLKDAGKIDIVENPELLENPDIAAEFAILYFINSFKGRRKDLNSYTSLSSAVKDYVQANAGWGTDIYSGHTAQGLAKAMDYASSIA